MSETTNIPDFNNDGKTRLEYVQAAARAYVTHEDEGSGGGVTRYRLPRRFRSGLLGAKPLSALGWVGAILGCGGPAPVTRTTCSEADQCAGTTHCYSICMCEEQDRDSCEAACPNDVPRPPLITSETIDDWKETQFAILDVINDARDKGGCCDTEGCFGPAPALSAHATLEAAALQHATDMADRGYLSHTSPDGRTPFDRIRAEGFQGCFMGENIASGDFSPESLVSAWLASPSHCANVLESTFVFAGLGSSTAGVEPVWVLTLGG